MSLSLSLRRCHGRQCSFSPSMTFTHAYLVVILGKRWVERQCATSPEKQTMPGHAFGRCKAMADSFSKSIRLSFQLNSRVLLVPARVVLRTRARLLKDFGFTSSARFSSLENVYLFRGRDVSAWIWCHFRVWRWRTQCIFIVFLPTNKCPQLFTQRLGLRCNGRSL